MSRRVTFRDLPVWREVGDGRRVPAHEVPCPECGGALEVDVDVEAGNPRTGTRRIVARLAFCTGCEFVHEF